MTSRLPPAGGMKNLARLKSARLGAQRTVTGENLNPNAVGGGQRFEKDYLGIDADGSIFDVPESDEQVFILREKQKLS